jgi:intracellular septation protein
MTGALALTALIAGALALAWRWRPLRALDQGVRVLLGLYALLGAWALLFAQFAPGHEPLAFVWYKPTVLYWALAALLIVAPPLGWGYPVQAIFGTYFVFTGREWRWINLAIAVAALVLGGLNLAIVFYHTQDDWEGYKWSCMVNVIAVFILRVTFVWVDLVARVIKHLHARTRPQSP